MLSCKFILCTILSRLKVTMYTCSIRSYPESSRRPDSMELLEYISRFNPSTPRLSRRVSVSEQYFCGQSRSVVFDHFFVLVTNLNSCVDRGNLSREAHIMDPNLAQIEETQICM